MNFELYLVSFISSFIRWNYGLRKCVSRTQLFWWQTWLVPEHSNCKLIITYTISESIAHIYRYSIDEMQTWSMSFHSNKHFSNQLIFRSYCLQHKNTNIFSWGLIWKEYKTIKHYLIVVVFKNMLFGKAETQTQKQAQTERGNPLSVVEILRGK